MYVADQKKKCRERFGTAFVVKAFVGKMKHKNAFHCCPAMQHHLSYSLFISFSRYRALFTSTINKYQVMTVSAVPGKFAAGPRANNSPHTKQKIRA